MKLSVVVWPLLGHLAAAYTPLLPANTYKGKFPDECPELCSVGGASSYNWTRVHDLKTLNACREPMILDFNVQALLDDPKTSVNLRACVFTGHETFNATSISLHNSVTTGKKDDNPLVVTDSCGAKTASLSVVPKKDVSTHRASISIDADDTVKATSFLRSYLDRAGQCGNTISFATFGSAVVGLYACADVAHQGELALLAEFEEAAHTGAYSLQVCQAKNASYSVGISAAPKTAIAAAQEAVRSWANGECLSGGASLPSSQMTVLVSKIGGAGQQLNSTHPMNFNSTAHKRSLHQRDLCRMEKVKHNDGCAELASRCGIPGDDITKYNPQPGFCGTLKDDQVYCCGPGDLPDNRPKPNSDGSCYAYPTTKNDNCYDLAHTFGITQDDIENFNKNTWGWIGCGNVPYPLNMCLSSGSPPMPISIPGVICGPQVPGTQRPTDGTAISDLNPCPLNACCDIWGWCGTTPDFCTPTPADSGAPGTARPGTNGCISNCGTDLVNNGSPPDQFRTVGYYEGFNYERKCMHMDASSIVFSATPYTHIHFAFGTLNADFSINMTHVQSQFDHFAAQSGFKKILSFGGWDFSTDPSTYTRFRDSTKPENRDGFVNALVYFINNNDIDGFDFDWEYPAAPDIPGIPPGARDEGQNFLGFLSLLRSRLPPGKSISIALPSSFWYLSPYPVKDMSLYVDYFVFMTYDLHGQWDVDNKWAIPSCDGGNCLLSHVNKTETLNSLVMLSKAGISSKQVVVGVSSYGRGFRMSDENCAGPFRTFRGGKGQSQAYKGKCTDTAGYISNAEINDIIANSSYSIKKSFVDDGSNSNILMYGEPGNVDWVAYMDGDLKQNRISWIKSLNMGGSSDWAIDLESFLPESNNPSSDDDDDDDIDDPSYIMSCDWDNPPRSLQAVADASDTTLAMCRSLYTLNIFKQQLTDGLAHYAEYSQGYDDKFPYYVEYVRSTIDSSLDNYMRLSGGPGLQYFDCDYSAGNRKGSTACTGMPHFWEDNIAWEIDFHLRDHDGFFAAIEKDLGILQDWVIFGNDDTSYQCKSDDLGTNNGSGDKGVPGSGNHGGSGTPPPCRKLYTKKHGKPMKASDDKIVVGNPKELVQKALTNITALQDEIGSAYIAIGFDVYGMTFDDDPRGGFSLLDPADAYSLPVFQITSSIESMKRIKELGALQEQHDKTDFILKVLNIVLMVIPFVGEGFGAIVGGAAGIARIISLASSVAQGAVTIFEIAKDPGSAPFAILEFVLGSGFGLGKGSPANGLEDAASARRLLKGDQLAKFDKDIQDQEALVGRIVERCSL